MIPLISGGDIENNLIPPDLEVEKVLENITASLRRRKYMGEVTVRAIYARYSVHITKELESKLKSVNIACRHLGYDDANVPKVPGAPVTIAVEKDDAKVPNIAPQNIADDAIKKEIDNFILDAANAPPHILMVITGDRGFRKKLTELNQKGYKTLAAFRQDASAEEVNACVFDSWFWRMLLGLREKVDEEEKIKNKRSKRIKREQAKGDVNLEADQAMPEDPSREGEEASTSTEQGDCFNKSKSTGNVNLEA